MKLLNIIRNIVTFNPCNDYILWGQLNIPNKDIVK